MEYAHDLLKYIKKRTLAGTCILDAGFFRYCHRLIDEKCLVILKHTYLVMNSEIIYDTDSKLSFLGYISVILFNPQNLLRSHH